jgi:hypothetical protein
LVACICVTAIALTASTRSRAADEATRIEIDQKAQVIRFMIDGHERAILDDAGLHVQGDITYVGMIKDIGAEGYSAAGRDDANAR